MRMDDVLMCPYICPGNFFAVNLFLIIINAQFSMTQTREHALMKAMDERRQKVLAQREEQAVMGARSLCLETALEVSRKLRAEGLPIDAAEVELLINEADMAEDREDMTACNLKIKDTARWLRQQVKNGFPGREVPADAIEELARMVTYNLSVNQSPMKTFLLNLTCCGMNFCGLEPDQLLDALASFSQMMDRCMYTESESIASSRRMIRFFTESETFNNLMVSIIFANCLVMASEHHGQADSMYTFQESLNIIFTFVFAFEFFAKLWALGECMPAHTYNDSNSWHVHTYNMTCICVSSRLSVGGCVPIAGPWVCPLCWCGLVLR